MGAVLQGTVSYADERVRVTTQLTDVGTDSVLWADIFDRALTLEALFDMQSDIADGVAAGLEAFARGRRRARRTDADGELARLRGVLARQVSLPPQATG